MYQSSLLSLAAVLLFAATPAKADDYTILGSVIFGRHGDRQAKPATYLTPMGATQQYDVGQWYRKRYFGLDADNNKDTNSTTVIEGLNDDGYYIDGQIYGETALSNIVYTSHYAFLQGLYPPTNIDSSSEMAELLIAELSNGTDVDNPLNGYQYVKSNVMPNATDGYIWVNGDENCPALNKAIKQTQNSDHFYKPGNASYEFLQSLYSIDFIKETFKQEQLVFSNAMGIYDKVWVNSIHNETVAEQFNDTIIGQISYWANLYQWTLSDKTINPDLTIGGQTLVGKILKQLNTTRTAQTPYLTYMTGAFSNMFQLSSVLDLYTQSDRFQTLPSYSATYVFELLSNGTDDTFVRFSFKNGTDEMGDEFTSYPLFNTTETVLPWSEFESKAKEISVRSVDSWCGACGYDELSPEATLEMCVPSSDLYSSAVKLEAEGVNLDNVKTSSSNLSLADAGGIGAGTTIGVFLILGGAFYLIKKWRGSKKQSAPILPVAATVSTHSTEIGSVEDKE